MSTRTTINLVEVLAMPSEQISKIKEKILAEIKDFEKKIEIRRAMLEYSDELEEDIGEDAPDEDETEYILPHSALPTSQLPPPEDGRFIKATQDEVTLAILNEFSPAPLHYEKIARLAVRNGYKKGHKTAKSMYGSFATSCSRLAKKGLIERVGVKTGTYKANGQSANGEAQQT